MQGGWQWVGGALMLFAFALPFLLLLSRRVKQQGPLLARVAAAILIMHWVDLWWFVVPAFRPTGVYLHWMDLATLVGIGGIWVAVFIWRLNRQALLPRHDPGLEATTRHG
jgi:peptidoglycan/LPS O-acetylase OafA/YrhL